MAGNPGRPEAPDEDTAGEEAAALEARYGHLEPELLIELALDRFFPEQIAAVSSFGADSAVLLHMIAEIDRTLPILFLDTGKHFVETIAYRDGLVRDLGLTDLRVVAPDPAALQRHDAGGDLHGRDADRCCAIRKVEPMRRAVAPFRAWFTGRKRFQSGSRAQLPVFEASQARVRINPLARWSAADIETYLAVHRLRRHPLVARGYPSIGCLPCTSPVAPGADPRSGRWAGLEKTECGIHFGPSGSVIRTPEAIGNG
jgi:phosphoadenosine phosphosulfate reductase